MTHEIAGQISRERLLAGWAPARLARRLEILEETDSTNRVALACAEQTDADGLVILAEYQTAGRGRLGRVWASPRGASVLCSVLLFEDEPDEAPPEPLQKHPGMGGWLTLAAAVGACEAMRASTQISAAIKWPNDLRYAGKKLGGILIESRQLSATRRAWVIGIGINCLQHPGHFPIEWRAGAISLDQLSDHPIDRTLVARELLIAWDDRFRQINPEGNQNLRAEWLNWAEPLGQRVHLRCGGRDIVGRTLDVDPWGGLIVQSDAGGREWLDPLRTSVEVSTPHD